MTLKFGVRGLIQASDGRADAASASIPPAAATICLKVGRGTPLEAVH